MSEFDEFPEEYSAHPQQLTHQPEVYFSVTSPSGQDTKQIKQC